MSISLPANEIHLWYLSTEQLQAPLLAQYQAIISAEETKRHQRFLFEKDRKHYLATRALIRHVLSLYIDKVLPEDWQFTQNDYGKPEVVSEMLPFPLKFNLSNTKSMVVLAVAYNQEVGVDVERLDRNVATDSLANYAFSADEYQQLKALDAGDVQGRFFDLWTLKEAYIKACGMGLSIPLDSFSFVFSAQNKLSIKFDRSRQDNPAAWTFWQFKPNQAHLVSLAIKDHTTKTDSSDSSYKLVMREIVPSVHYSAVNYPVIRASAPQ